MKTSWHCSSHYYSKTVVVMVWSDTAGLQKDDSIENKIIGFIHCLSLREKPDVVSPCCGLPLVLLRAGFLLLHVLVHADGE